MESSLLLQVSESVVRRASPPRLLSSLKQSCDYISSVFRLAADFSLYCLKQRIHSSASLTRIVAGRRNFAITFLATKLSRTALQRLLRSERFPSTVLVHRLPGEYEHQTPDLFDTLRQRCCLYPSFPISSDIWKDQQSVKSGTLYLHVDQLTSSFKLNSRHSAGQRRRYHLRAVPERPCHQRL